MTEFVVATKSLTYAGARAALDAALAKAAELGVPINVSVCDNGGNPLAFARMDGAATMSGSIAVNKAWSVASFMGVPTSLWWDIIKDEPALREGIVHTDRLTIFGGGVAIVDADGERVGAIGVSGGTAAQDEEIANAGAAAVSVQG